MITAEALPSGGRLHPAEGMGVVMAEVIDDGDLCLTALLQILPAKHARALPALAWNGSMESSAQLGDHVDFANDLWTTVGDPHPEVPRLLTVVSPSA